MFPRERLISALCRLAGFIVFVPLAACGETKDQVVSPAPSASSTGTVDSCPSFETSDFADHTPVNRGSCSTQGATCITEPGPTSCRGYGPGGLVAGHCTCDGVHWSCVNYVLGKGSGCPVNPCDTLTSQPAPQQTKENLLYCSASTGTSCDVSLRELCSDGSEGQTVKWNCACDNSKGSYTCIPSPQGDATCP